MNPIERSAELRTYLDSPPPWAVPSPVNFPEIHRIAYALFQLGMKCAEGEMTEGEVLAERGVLVAAFESLVKGIVAQEKLPDEARAVERLRGANEERRYAVRYLGALRPNHLFTAIDLLRILKGRVGLTPGENYNGQLKAEEKPASESGERPPVPMFLTCPMCSARHVDTGEFATRVHHTHSCQKCGLTWRPAVEPTVGVEFLPGFKSEEIRPVHARGCSCEACRLRHP